MEILQQSQWCAVTSASPEESRTEIAAHLVSGHSFEQAQAMDPRDQQFVASDSSNLRKESIFPAILPLETVASWWWRTMCMLGIEISVLRLHLIEVCQGILHISGAENLGCEANLERLYFPSPPQLDAKASTPNFSDQLFTFEKIWLHAFDRSCEECRSASRAKFKVVYLSVMHAFPFMTLCPIHGNRLDYFRPRRLSSLAPAFGSPDRERFDKVLTRYEAEALAFARFIASALDYKEPLNLDASIQILNLIQPREEMVMYASAVSKDRHSWKTIPRNPVAVWVHAAFRYSTFDQFLDGYRKLTGQS